LANTPRRNITIALTPDTVRKARVLAADRGTSVSGLVGKLIEGEVQQRERFEAARARALLYLGRGFDMGSGGKLPARESINDR
jgi:hypothetical protein